jgi:hypothetical protein
MNDKIKAFYEEQKTFAKHNDHGVYPTDQCELVRKWGPNWSIVIYIANAGQNIYCTSYAVSYGGEGMGSLPNESGPQFSTRDQAIAYCVNELTSVLYRKSKEWKIEPMIKYLSSLNQLPLF